MYNNILLETSGSHSNIISDRYIFHYGNELVSRTGNKEIRHFVTTNYDQKYPFAVAPCRMVGVSASVIFPCTMNSRRFLLAPAHPGSPGERAVKRLCFCVLVLEDNL